MGEINLSNINWNNLSINEFHELEKKMQQIKIDAKGGKREKRSNGMKTVKIRGGIYIIKEVVYNRLKAMKSEKSKDKLINEIISTHNPIEQL